MPFLAVLPRPLGSDTRIRSTDKDANPIQFPTDEEQQHAVGNHKSQHGRREQLKEEEEPGEVFVVRHVTDAIDENEQTHEGHHHQHPRRQRIQHPTKPAR